MARGSFSSERGSAGDPGLGEADDTAEVTGAADRQRRLAVGQRAVGDAAHLGPGGDGPDGVVGPDVGEVRRELLLHGCVARLAGGLVGRLSALVETGVDLGVL